jgi:small subunit ribosomal protein S6
VRKYECIVVLHPGVSADAGASILGRFEATVANHGGTILDKDEWGTRTLAYPIEKNTSGIYTFYRFMADNTLVKEADRDFRLDDRVLRHLLVIDEEWEARNRAAMAKRAARAGASQGEADDGQ